MATLFSRTRSVLLNLGFDNHLCYPASVHQYLSPNDNRLHGTAKQSWRALELDYSDDVESCVCLLHYLDRDIVAHSKLWFKRNMLELKEEDVEQLVGLTGKNSRQHKGWLRAYRIFIGEDARGPRPELPDNLADKLDGVYWEQF